MSAILLGVRDMDRSKRFYIDGLGWQVEHDYGVSVFFEPDGGSLVGFYGRLHLEHRLQRPGTGPAVRGLATDEAP